MNSEPWGIILSFLDHSDPRPAREQFDEQYVGGWHSIKGFSFNTNQLTYPGDPPLRAISEVIFCDESIMIFPYAMVLILQPDGSFEVSRMD